MFYLVDLNRDYLQLFSELILIFLILVRHPLLSIFKNFCFNKKYNSKFEEDTESEKDEYKIRIVYFPDTNTNPNTYNESLQKVVDEKCIYNYIALLRKKL